MSAIALPAAGIRDSYSLTTLTNSRLLLKSRDDHCRPAARSRMSGRRSDLSRTNATPSITSPGSIAAGVARNMAKYGFD
jgi:hypothetical protein